MTENKPARVRFAPSPTGRMHLGSARTALYNYLLARQTGGQFILRLEDTDQKRYVSGAEDELVRGLHWLGIDWDEGFDIGGPHAPYRQSERKVIYQQHARQLIESDHAYYCFCTPERLERLRQEQIQRRENPRYDGLCRRIPPDQAAARVAAGEKHVVRFKTPHDGVTRVYDRLRGEISIENSTLDDFVIVKSDGLALYHLAAMVDDHLMKITHVFRGSEWLPTFPLHAMIIRAFGWEEPEWVHLSVFLKPDGKGKMSKRDSAALADSSYSVFVEELQENGYVPEAVVNWVALMGWSYDDRTEFFTLPDLVEKFSIEKLNPSPASINFSKLDHFNGLHIRALPHEILAERVKPFLERAGYTVDMPRLLQIIPIIQERLPTLDEAPQIAGFFFQEEVHPDPEDLVGKKMTAGQSVDAACKAHDLLANIPEIRHDTVEQPLRDLADSLGIKAGQLFGILRAAVTGQKISPPLLESMEIIGKEVVLERLRKAISILETLAAEEQQTT